MDIASGLTQTKPGDSTHDRHGKDEAVERNVRRRGHPNEERRLIAMRGWRSTPHTHDQSDHGKPQDGHSNAGVQPSSGQFIATDAVTVDKVVECLLHVVVE